MSLREHLDGDCWWRCIYCAQEMADADLADEEDED